MFHYYEYEYLLKKIDEHYEGDDIRDKIVALSKDLRITIMRMKNILENRNMFLQVEMNKIIELFGLSNEEIIKCFFTYELSFKDHRDVVRYVIKKEKEERKKRDK